MQPLATLQCLLATHGGPVQASARAQAHGVALQALGDDATTLAQWHTAAAAALPGAERPWCVVDASSVFSDGGRALLAATALHGSVVALALDTPAGDIGPLALLEACPHVQLTTPGRGEELAALMGAARHSGGVHCIVLPRTWAEQAVEPSLHPDQHADALRGLYLMQPGGPQSTRVQLLGSGAALGPVLQAAEELARYGIAADVWSWTGPTATVLDGRATEQAWLQGHASAAGHLAQRLAATTGPLIAATPYARALPEQLRAFMPAQRRFLTLSLPSTPDAGGLVTRAALQVLGDEGRNQARAELRRLDDLAHLAVT